EPRLVLGLADAHLGHVLLQAGDVTVEVIDGDLGPDPGMLQAGEFAGRPVQFGEFGQGASPVGQLRERGVDRLEIQKAALGFLVGLHGRGSFGTSACSVHGSVCRSETTVSTPRSVRNCAARASSQGRSVAQWAASSSAGPPSARYSLAG